MLAMNEEVKQARPGDIISLGELAEFLQLHRSMPLHSSTIYRRLRQGVLPAFKVGSHWRFSCEAIHRLVRLEAGQ